MNYVSGDSISLLDDDQHMKNNIICSTTTTVMSSSHNNNQSITTIPTSSSTSILSNTGSASSSSSIIRNRQRKIKPPKQIPLTLDGYWPGVIEDIKHIKQVDAKNQHLPLARIKKIMKLDENAKMIAAEAPLLFAKACEYFIQELTLRAWIHTEENKRRTLQRSDIATAISRCDQFDFLIDIVPREEVKQTTTSSSNQTSNNNNNNKKYDTETPKPSTSTTTTSTNLNTNNTTIADPIQYYLQLSGGQQLTLQQNPQSTTTIPTHHTGILSQSIPNAGNQGIAQLNVMPAAGPQNILLNTQQTLVNALHQQQQHQQQQQHHQQQPQQQQQIQLFQQILTQNGEIQSVPITLTPNNLNLLRMQMQGNITGQPHQQQLIIQQQPQIMQVSGTGNTNTVTSSGQTNQNAGIFLNQATIQHQQQQQQQQTNIKQGNINNFRSNC